MEPEKKKKTPCERKGHNYYNVNDIFYCGKCANIVPVKDIAPKEEGIEKMLNELERRVAQLEKSEENSKMIIEDLQKLITLLSTEENVSV